MWEAESLSWVALYIYEMKIAWYFKIQASNNRVGGQVIILKDQILAIPFGSK